MYGFHSCCCLAHGIGIVHILLFYVKSCFTVVTQTTPKKTREICSSNVCVVHVREPTTLFVVQHASTWPPLMKTVSPRGTSHLSTSRAPTKSGLQTAAQPISWKPLNASHIASTAASTCSRLDPSATAVGPAPLIVHPCTVRLLGIGRQHRLPRAIFN